MCDPRLQQAEAADEQEARYVGLRVGLGFTYAWDCVRPKGKLKGFGAAIIQPPKRSMGLWVSEDFTCLHGT